MIEIEHSNYELSILTKKVREEVYDKPLPELNVYAVNPLL